MTKPNMTLISILSTALMSVTAASAQEVETVDMEESASCDAMLAEIDAEVESAITTQAALQQEMSVKARELPLLLHLSDGSFVYLGSYDGLGEPIESWFVSQEVVEERRAESETARNYLASGDETACLTALSNDN